MSIKKLITILVVLSFLNKDVNAQHRFLDCKTKIISFKIDSLQNSINFDEKASLEDLHLQYYFYPDSPMIISINNRGVEKFVCEEIDIVVIKKIIEFMKNVGQKLKFPLTDIDKDLESNFNSNFKFKLHVEYLVDSIGILSILYRIEQKKSSIQFFLTRDTD